MTIHFQFIEELPRKRGRKLGSGQREPGARELDMKSLYTTGSTLEQIGEKYKITRERVRQLLNKYFGIDAKDGGQTIRGLLKTTDKREELRRRRERMERNKLRFWGMPLDEYRAHVKEFGSSSDQKTPMGRFVIQRKNAIHGRGIGWNITFKEWWQLWQDSGKWEQRGRGQDKYVMARYGDTDPYQLGNVYICLATENNSERDGKKSGLPIGVHATHFKTFIAAKMVNGRQWHVGTFATPELAHEAYLNFIPKGVKRK